MSGINAYRGGPGIELISRRDRTPDTQLPEGNSAPPIDGSLQLRLPTVLFQPSLDQALVDALEPTILDRSILQPEHFHQLIDTSRDQLQRLGASAAAEEERQAFVAADAVLSRLTELRDTLSLLRSIIQRA